MMLCYMRVRRSRFKRKGVPQSASTKQPASRLAVESQLNNFCVCATNIRGVNLPPWEGSKDQIL